MQGEDLSHLCPCQHHTYFNHWVWWQKLFHWFVSNSLLFLVRLSFCVWWFIGHLNFWVNFLLMYLGSICWRCFDKFAHWRPSERLLKVLIRGSFTLSVEMHFSYRGEPSGLQLESDFLTTWNLTLKVCL